MYSFNKYVLACFSVALLSIASLRAAGKSQWEDRHQNFTAWVEATEERGLSKSGRSAVVEGDGVWRDLI
ncbi:MAG: hypothetical protein L3J39_02805 [Verrucomicrobiales bacterium]|nr:hypothetical protein [Verrucomicrobiales bacterium]